MFICVAVSNISIFVVIMYTLKNTVCRPPIRTSFQKVTLIKADQSETPEGISGFTLV